MRVVVVRCDVTGWGSVTESVSGWSRHAKHVPCFALENSVWTSWWHIKRGPDFKHQKPRSLHEKIDGCQRSERHAKIEYHAAIGGLYLPFWGNRHVIRMVDPKEYRVSESAARECKYTCNTCNSVFKTLAYVRKHIATIHLNWKSLQCDLCPEMFKYYHNKQAHLQKEHGVEVKRYKKRVVEGNYVCDTCNAFFKIRGELVKHIKKVHSEYKCPHCEKYFRKNRLVLHLDEAHGIPAPTCGVCGFKDFAHARILRHQREVHMREKNSFCPYCDSSFFNSTQLRNHIIKHTGERNFSCSICHKTFARKSALRMHYKIHTGEKRKVCHICQQAFVQKASLNYHMAKHHPEQP
ncbi:PR domain zinc finger protein 5 [Eumeta japonica]|uniref:PR domain zinc finger protein 5 n=1 Tax=Eumeta variegata TaxID=151549 RepID=A0A4C1VUC6_EUMVA|nr:PR domain zinc finger protein 5 [Eumeta japonica]